MKKALLILSLTLIHGIAQADPIKFSFKPRAGWPVVVKNATGSTSWDQANKKVLINFSGNVELTDVVNKHEIEITFQSNIATHLDTSSNRTRSADDVNGLPIRAVEKITTPDGKVVTKTWNLTTDGRTVWIVAGVKGYPQAGRKDASMSFEMTLPAFPPFRPSSIFGLGSDIVSLKLGDINENGAVDDADIKIVQENMGQGPRHQNGDANFDGYVKIDDLNIVRNQKQ